MFLPDPPASPAAEAAYEQDLAGDGYVNNNSRLWAYRPDVNDLFVELRSILMEGSALSERELAVLLVAHRAGEWPTPTPTPPRRTSPRSGTAG
jgi:hypothetical protein